VIGLVYIKDALRLLEKRQPVVIRKILHPAQFVPESKKVGALLKELQKRRSHMALVIDEHGSVTGLVTLEDLVSDALRMNPDRILVGECRGPETMAMLWSFATGHAGMTSVHGESAEHALRNLVRFALTSGARIEAEQALDWVRDVDLVVHCDRPRAFGAGERRFLPRWIDEIVEVSGVEGRRLTLNPLFEGAGPELCWLGSGPAYIDELEQAGFHVG